MSISSIISLFGGLGMFLFGMQYMGDGLQLAAGARMKDLLEKLTRNPFKGFLLGAFVTVVIQSSSATTVMAMGFINAGIMDLTQATGVIFGANIGTTITSVLIALDASGIAPFCIFAGAFLMLYSKKKKTQYIGQVILGFGLLFQGLRTMSDAMSELKNVEWFRSFIMNTRSPLLGLLVGAVMCAVIQSSSAAVGILQALAMQGLMPLYFASFLICGVNIGSAMPTFLAAMKAKNNAKRAAVVYLINNVAGAVIMTIVTLVLPYTEWVEQYVADPAFQVSVMHIIFKVVSAAVLLPNTKHVVNLTYKIIPKQTHEDACRLEYIDVNMIGAPSVALLQIRSEVERMTALVRQNITMAMGSVLSGRPGEAEAIAENETVIDYLTDAISDFLVKFNVREITGKEAQYVTHVFQALSDLERIGDYAEILNNLVERQSEQGMAMSEEARKELSDVSDLVLNLYDKAVAAFYSQNENPRQLSELARMQHNVRKMTKQSQLNHMERLREGKCNADTGIIFGDMLNSLNRIGGHSINIAEAAVVARETD